MKSHSKLKNLVELTDTVLMKKSNCVSLQEFKVSISKLDLPKPVTLKKESSVNECLQLMQQNKFGAIIIEENNRPIGIVSERDFLRKYEDSKDFLNQKVEKIMVANPICIEEGMLTIEAINFMSIKKIRHLPVVDSKGNLKYMLSAKDLLRFAYNFFIDELSSLGILTKLDSYIGDILSDTFLINYQDSKGDFDKSIFFELTKNVVFPGCLIVDINDDVNTVLEKMRESNHAVAIVSEYETQLKGIITERDFLLKIFGKGNLDKNIQSFMTPNPHCLLGKNFLVYAFNNMFTFNYRNVVVVNEDHYPVAVLSMNDMIIHFNRAMKSSEQAA